MRIHSVMVLASLAWFLPAALCSVNAQTPSPPSFRYGTSYTFERLNASRSVDDEFDRGNLTLVANVYRPTKGDRREVVLFSHGSTGGWVTSPKEASGAPPLSVVEFFVSRGFTVVAPMRRGVGFSTGTYREECPFNAGEYTLAENTAVSTTGLEEARRDTGAVVNQIIFGKLVPTNSKILLVGISRGGFLSLITAGQRPELAKGVVNFVGGWLSISDKWPESENAARLRFQCDQLASAGKRARVPTVWVYGARDGFYSETVTRQFFRAFMEAGGQGDYVFVAEHPLPNGHNIANQLALWGSRVDQFLSELK